MIAFPTTDSFQKRTAVVQTACDQQETAQLRWVTQIDMSRLMRFPTSVPRDPEVDAWMREHPGELGAIAKDLFSMIRNQGADVRELLHDGHPTACVGDAAFAYVNAFKAHVNVGFFCGPELEDPSSLLEGTGKFMRHVKLRPGSPVDMQALEQLIEAAYKEIKARAEIRGD